jgi:hypothetical protein
MTNRTIDELFDRQDILELLYRYCSAADRNEPPGMLAAFVEDCVVSYVPDAEPMRGKAALGEMLRAFLGNVVSGSHYVTNPVFEFVGPGEALLGCYMYSWQRFTGYPALADVHRYGRYELRFVRTGEGWRITHLRLLSAGEFGGERIAEQMGRAATPIMDLN